MTWNTESLSWNGCRSWVGGGYRIPEGMPCSGEGGCCRGVRTKGQTGARSRVRVCPLIRLDYRSSHPNSDDAVLRK